MTSRIKCGVIGAGWWGTYAHIPALLGHPNAELVALQNQNPVVAKRVAEHFGIPHAFANAAELLDVKGLQAVIVSSSPNMHYEHTSAAFDHDMHVLIEKPMTITAIESALLVETAKRKHLQFLISSPLHFTQHASEARELVRSGSLGDLRMISVLMTNPVEHLLRGTTTLIKDATAYMNPCVRTYSDPKVAGGGQIYSQVFHVAAYLAFLMEMDATEVFARFHYDGARVDLYNIVNLRMGNGAIVSITSTAACGPHQRDFEIRIYGTEGILQLDLWRGTMAFLPARGNRINYPRLNERDIYPQEAPAQNLIDSISDPERNQSPATLGERAMRIVEAALISSRENRNVLIGATSR